MRKLFTSILVTFVLLQWTNFAHASSLQSAYENHQINVQVKDSGTVIRILKDDNKGSRHQKFILKLSSGQTILIAHNIDLAPRINSISKGDVVHWTHRDPNGRHVGGWLKHNGSTYQ